MSDALDFLKTAALGKRKPKRDPKYATFNRRMMAATVDSLLFMIAAPIFDRLAPLNPSTLPQYAPDPANDEAVRQWMRDMITNREFVASLLSNWGLQIFFLCVVSAVCWHFWQATPGKMLLRIKIVDAETEGAISTKQIVIRASAYIVSGLCFFLGFFWIGIDTKRRSWHDMLAHTVVVTLPWRKPKPTVEIQS